MAFALRIGPQELGIARSRCVISLSKRPWHFIMVTIAKAIHLYFKPLTSREIMYEHDSK